VGEDRDWADVGGRGGRTGQPTSWPSREGNPCSSLVGKDLRRGPSRVDRVLERPSNRPTKLQTYHSLNPPKLSNSSILRPVADE
jgi:hypothetical protein